MKKYIKNNYKLLYILFIIILLSSCKKSNPLDKPPIVSNSTVAKFEYINEVDIGYKLITSEIATLHTFDSLSLKKSDTDEEFDWIYRITFNPNDILKNGTEIVILFGEDKVSVNGKNYEPSNKENITSVLEWASSKYSFFDYELK